jgi:hypothetical protein
MLVRLMYQEIMIKCVVFEYQRENGRGCITDWLRGFSAGPRARFHVRLDQIELHGVGESVEETKMICPHIADGFYKVKVKSVPVLRPFLCRGPVEMSSEVTFLIGAIEEDDQLYPPRAEILDCCRIRRSEVVADATRRQPYDRNFYVRKESKR